MSGGAFNYSHYHIEDIANEIEELISNNKFSPETITKFKETVIILNIAALMVKRIDWLVSEDDNEKTFLQLWGEIEKYDKKT